MTVRTARAIREWLTGEGRVYLREMLTATPRRVFDARERKGAMQVKTAEGWHTVLNGDDILAV